jgi:hypothetical protein
MSPASPDPAAAPRSERCPLCGTAFEAEGQGCRPSCALSKGCSVVCCPSCGYGFPQETGLAGRLRRLLDRFHHKERLPP